MSPKNTSRQDETKVGAFISAALSWLSTLFSSIVKFTKASFLSLIIIVAILLLLTKMDQAFTMFVDLIEVNGIKWGLLLSFFLINALALALSHYPIYNYYAANLNNSAAFTIWKGVYPFKSKLFKIFKVFVFTEKPGGVYKKDETAHYLRYSIGLLIHSVWILFIIKTFLPKFDLSESQETTVMWMFYALCILPLLHYVYIRRKVKKAQRDNNTAGLYKKLAARFTALIALTLLLSISCLIYDWLFSAVEFGLFSRAGFFLLVGTCYLFMFNYLYFRLLRTKLDEITELYGSAGSRIVARFMNIFKRIFFKSENYLMLFSFNFIFALTIIIWSTIMAVNVGDLPNGTPLLLAFFYAYYFVIAAIGKFFFAYSKMREQKGDLSDKNHGHSLRFKVVCIGILILLIGFIAGNFSEVRTHQLSLIDRNPKSDLKEDLFIQGIKNMDGNSVFFIASHGGGLKSNAWTLHVLEKLHLETNGHLMNRTIALSGASGGSLGLALYTGLSKELSGNQKNDAALLNDRIDRISEGNYTSSDIALTFGLDTFRKFWPINQELFIQDRPYYAMIKYQNYVANKKSKKLSKTPYRTYWKEVYNKRGYFPSLIMNTAATTGRRGILWSVQANNFDSIFHFSEDLAELKSFEKNMMETQQKTLGFYEAVSTTNRFPVFSPAAKIPGYGHYIDAGAIDNSGMLGCLDLYLYLQSLDDFNFLSDKKVVFIEIINSKSLYLDHLLKSIEKGHIQKDENETDNIIADLQTALNLDKIPGYVSDFTDNYERIELIKIFMPHKISIGDVENYLNGDIENKVQRKQLIEKLKDHNNYIDGITEQASDPVNERKFFKKWNTYEPTLSRHLSESSLLFIEKILEHESISTQIEKIKTHINN